MERMQSIEKRKKNDWMDSFLSFFAFSEVFINSSFLLSIYFTLFNRVEINNKRSGISSFDKQTGPQKWYRN